MATIIISGLVSGTGKINYNLNNSNLSGYNPQLIAENIPYNICDCPIAAIEYQGFSPNKIVNINSKENSIYENTLDYHKVEFLDYTGLYPIEIYNYPYNTNYNSKLKYLITDQLSNFQNGKPLFYQYELLFDSFSAILEDGIKNIYKNNEIKINKTEYKIQYSSDTLSGGYGRYSDTTWTETTPNQINRVRVLLPEYFSNNNDFFTIEYNKYVNGLQNYQRELIELKDLYTTDDYNVTSSGLMLTENTRITLKQSLFLIKDPKYRIYPLDIISVKGQGYSEDKSVSWKLRINTGSFFQNSGIFMNQNPYLYNIESYNDIALPLTYITPTLINSNILKIKETPLYIDESVYVYPLYKVNPYDRNIATTDDSSGTFSIDINGIERNDIKIKSIDRQKGFIELDTDLSITDDIDIFCYINSSGFIIIENLELNPKINDDSVSYNISDYNNGFGIALKSYDSTEDSKYPYIYSLSEPDTGEQIPDVGETGSPVTIDDSFFRMCEVNINKLTTDIVKVTDARKVGGGVIQDKNLDTWFVNNYKGIQEHEKLWYTDIGNYDGLPLAHNSTILIHIPEDYINILRQKWIDYYKNSLDYDRAEIIGNKEFKAYLDQVIKRYISAGTDYIIIPTISGQVTNKFLSLR